MITSAATSINKNKLPATFHRVKLWRAGTVNLDIGGGKYDNATEFLAGYGVVNLHYDPYNRSRWHNEAVLKEAVSVDTVTVNNVLNVIMEPLDRDKAIRLAYDRLKEGGFCYFLIYEGNRDGEGKVTRNGWQENRKTETYVQGIRGVFGNAERHGNMIMATKFSQ